MGSEEQGDSDARRQSFRVAENQDRRGCVAYGAYGRSLPPRGFIAFAPLLS
jgi:hypothetical protein